MTTDRHEPAKPGADIAQAIADALKGDGRQAILDALSAGRVDLSLLRRFLGSAQLSEQQESMLNLLVALQTSDGSPSDPAESGDAPSAGGELADLRQVNDTLAAALGACRVCWGGDRECQQCNGHGAAGSGLPDMALFEQLVAPAVRRVGALRRAGNGFAPNRR